MSLQNEVLIIKNALLQELESINTAHDLEQWRILYLGRTGKISHLIAKLKNLSAQEKKEYGPLLNELKEVALHAYQTKKEMLEQQHWQRILAQEQFFDVTLSKPLMPQGSLHPITQMYNKIKDIFLSMGYTFIQGPEAENDYYNFEALNIPSDHPARDMWDTLWLDVPGMLLRTHTSPAQIHALEKRQLPLAVIAMGRVFRHEATDATHDFMFNQVEGLVVDKDISLAHLLGTLEQFFHHLFENKDLTIRVRPSYFPFVEPGVEIDISCPFCTSGCSLCKKTRWIELAGAGLVHPHVLKKCHIDSEQYSGFAFGFGIDRLTMLRYGINDIRLFSTNNLSFLSQF